MKRQALIKKLTAISCLLVRSKGPHDWYTNPATKQSQPVPRHAEINDFLAKSIIRKLSGK